MLGSVFKVNTYIHTYKPRTDTGLVTSHTDSSACLAAVVTQEILLSRSTMARRCVAPEEGCCDASQRAPSPTGDIEKQGAVAQSCLHETVQRDLADLSVGVQVQLHQILTGIRQPAAEQSTPQVRYTWPQNCRRQQSELGATTVPYC